MIKYKAISNYVGESTHTLTSHNREVGDFIEKINLNGHTFISCNTIAHGANMGILRTEIVYRENITREVIFEKKKASLSS